MDVHILSNINVLNPLGVSKFVHLLFQYGGRWIGLDYYVLHS